MVGVLNANTIAAAIFRQQVGNRLISIRDAPNRAEAPGYTG